MTYDILYLFTDGGARGNPGPAAIGVVLKDKKGDVLEQHGEKIGEKTNNQAEYQALIKGLQLAQKYQPRKLICLLDSSLVVNQLSGKFKVKNAGLRSLFFEAQKIMAQLKSEVVLKHISREKNTLADKLLNQALSK